MNDSFRILSIDGGGLKGLVAIKILQIIEEIADDKLVGLFDFFAGTSTGGLIVSALNAPQKNAVPLSLDEIEELYLQVAEKVVSEGRFNLSGKESEDLNKIFKRVFREHKLSSALNPLFIPAFDDISGENVFFTSREAQSDRSKDVSFVDVCHATSAVPYIFPPYDMKYGGRLLRCIDAGLYHLKNPAMVALSEVWRHRNEYKVPSQPENITLLSISTGSLGNNSNHWSTDIFQTYSRPTLKKHFPDLDVSKMRYMRVDINMKQGGLSISQVVEWTNAISQLSTNKMFRKDVEGLFV
jgi:uncharacterized protein